MAHQETQFTDYDHSDLYGKGDVDDQIVKEWANNKRELKKLKERVELQTELNRQLEKDKNHLISQLDSYRKRCSDLQKNLDDKDQHLNEVVASLTQNHKPMKKKESKKSGWFGFGTPRSSRTTPSSHNSNLYYTPQQPTTYTDSSPTDDYMHSPLGQNDPRTTPITPCMTAPMNLLPTDTSRRSLRRHDSVHIVSHNESNEDGNWEMSVGTSSLCNHSRSEMEFKIKNSSKDKLRIYVRDLFENYQTMEKKKEQLFHDLIKATHTAGWKEKEAINLDQVAKIAKEKEKNAKNHIKSLEKSLNKERKRIDKYKASFEIFKQMAMDKRKELLLSDKKLKDIISMKDEFIRRACSKLIFYKEKLTQFEIPVFQQYLVLVVPTLQELIRFDDQNVSAPNLGALHEDKEQAPGCINEDVNSAGGTVTSIASGYSTKSSTSIKSIYSISRKKSSSVDTNNGEVQDTKRKKKKSKKNKKKRIKSYETPCDEEDDEINLTISAKAKMKKRRMYSSKSKSASSSPRTPSVSITKEKKKKKSNIPKIDENNSKDYLDQDLDELVSSSSSSDEDEDDFILASDDDGVIDNDCHTDYALDHNGQFVENNQNSTSLNDCVELKLVKYPGTGELFMIVTKFAVDEKTEAMELFRCDFAKCMGVERLQIEEDFIIYFENISLVMRADSYEKANTILITLRQFFDQHCSNLQPELPPPPDTSVTDQMSLFFGGGF